MHLETYTQEYSLIYFCELKTPINDIEIKKIVYNKSLVATKIETTNLADEHTKLWSFRERRHSCRMGWEDKEKMFAHSKEDAKI